MKRKQPTSSPRCDHHTRELPAWFHRLVILTIIEDREIGPCDFDEDISELGEGEGDSDRDSLGVACECGSEDECECGSEVECECGSGSEDECECDLLDYEDDDDEESEHSYTGSDADYYYELKEQRTDRKMELRDEKKRRQEERNFTREIESRKEEEVHAAYEAMLEAQKRSDCPRRRLESIAGKTFYLYSVDHVDHCYDDLLYPSKYVEFYYIDADGEVGDPPDPNAKISGHAYMNVSSGCRFVPFCPPQRAGSQGTRLKVHGSDDEPVFQFISEKYLIMTVGADSEMIGKDIRESEPADVPDDFEFVGIHMDLEERKRQMQREREEMRSRRPPSPPSPRDTFFERCHPMGAWNMGWP